MTIAPTDRADQLPHDRRRGVDLDSLMPLIEGVLQVVNLRMLMLLR
jgi:hypothetical protein